MPARVNLYEEELDILLDQRGNNAEWQKAIVCSCVSSDSGQPDFSCPICGGSGFRYTSPKKIIVGVTALSNNKILESVGLREPGCAYVTPKSDVIMGYRDRIRFPDFKCIFSQTIKWEGANTISNKTYRELKGVEYLADDKYEYEEGIDFKITPDNMHLEWINPKIFDSIKDRNLSIRYLTTPSYLVADILHELRATLSDRKTSSPTFRELPKQYKMVREDFIYNVKEDGGKPPTDEIVPEITEAGVII